MTHNPHSPSPADGTPPAALAAKAPPTPFPRWVALVPDTGRSSYTHAYPHPETFDEYCERLNLQALAYNEDDAGPTIEYPAVRVFMEYSSSSDDNRGKLRVHLWTGDTDEDPSLATPDDLPWDVPMEVWRDDKLIFRHDPRATQEGQAA